jgi:hypothetical protein
MFEGESYLKLHIDGAAAETGVSRFGENFRTPLGEVFSSNDSNHQQQQQQKSWTYSKDESLKVPSDFLPFDILITGKDLSFYDSLNNENENENADRSCGAFVKVFDSPGISRMKLSKYRLFPEEFKESSSYLSAFAFAEQPLLQGINKVSLSVLNQSKFQKLPSKVKAIVFKMIEIFGGELPSSSSSSLGGVTSNQRIFKALYFPFLEVETTPQIYVLASSRLVKKTNANIDHKC